jgi:hypothetical protein
MRLIMLWPPVKRFRVVFVLLFLICVPLTAQFDPEGAQVLSYFPHFADGGAASQKWTTSLTFVNPHVSLPATGTVFLYGDNGAPLSLDLGRGRTSSFDFTVPPQGTVRFTSAAASAATVTGWALVSSTLPLQGVVQFRFSANGVPQQGVSAQATPASSQFRSPATGSTGIAVANRYQSDSVPVTVAAIDASGNTVAQSSLTVAALGHSSFTLGQLFPTLPAGFQGSVTIGSVRPEDTFVAWTVSGDSGVLSSYPPSGLAWPTSQYERIWKVWEKVLNVAVRDFPLGTPPQLIVDYTTSTINSYADPAHNQVHIFMNLAELISDSESELSFVVAHEIGHIIQARIGKLAFVPSNKEWDADQYGMLLSLVAGYDPYGAAGALAKLAMASGRAGLLDQNYDSLSAVVGVDLHGSFNNRLELIFEDMQQICALPQAQTLCALYKNQVHPHLPTIAPLARETPIQ